MYNKIVGSVTCAFSVCCIYVYSDWKAMLYITTFSLLALRWLHQFSKLSFLIGLKKSRRKKYITLYYKNTRLIFVQNLRTIPASAEEQRLEFSI